MPKYVVSSMLEDPGWQNSHRLAGDLVSSLVDVRDRTDGDLVVFSSGGLVRGLAECDLIDEYRYLLFPVVLGAGKRMFDDHGHLDQFELTDSVITSSGVAILTRTRKSSVE